MRRFAQKLPVLLFMGALVTYTGCKKDEENVMPVLSKPVIEMVSPSEGTIGTEIAIKGLSFTTNVQVLVGDQTSTAVEVVDGTMVYALVPAGIPQNTLLPVTVKNADGGEVRIENAFKTIAPDLNYVNSATKPSGNTGSTVILEGNAFGDVQGEGQVLFTDASGNQIVATVATAEDWTNTFIVTSVPAGAVDGEIKVKTATGISNALMFDVTDGATFSPSQISWKLAANLPLAVSAHQAVHVTIDDASSVTNQFVLVTGGRTTEAQNQVLSGKIGSTASVAAWSSTTALPVALSSHAAVAATPFNSKVSGSGFLYSLGGINAAGEPVSSVYTAALTQDGTVSAWTQGRALPEPLHSFGAVLFRGSIYIAGGATTGNVPVAKVYRAQIDTLGQLGEWQELTSLPAARAYHGFVSFGGYLYAVGGETGTILPDDANYQTNDTKLNTLVSAKINLRTGAITDAGWVAGASTMSKARSKHTTLVAGGAIFVSSGLYSGAGNGASENTYAVIGDAGVVGSFAGATGSNTLKAVGGNNLFNQTGVSYMDANGGMHVMIIGGDDVNVPGTKQSETIYY